MSIHRTHASFKIIQRGSGGASSVAKAAYMEGRSLKDERTGQRWTYELGHERVLASTVILPAGAPGAYADAEILWNAVETHEDEIAVLKHKDRPDLARTLQIRSFPTVVLLDGEGREVRRILGYQKPAEMLAWLKQ